MADINIVQQHKLTAEKAREAAQQVADKLAQEYDLACAWDGDVLRFERSGVDGSLTLEKEQAQLQIKLGFMLSAFASTIEGKIAEKMRKVFTETV
ncbi:MULTISPECIES: polyhydroxyalkanoic acid system family protein [Janthinobacterium]|uniref:Polyhydroxyalkanoic acid system family protein n=1 Tax=Janthinobacterium rivuli TaxID=2751478 RepID=A0ABY8I8T9_9BURK|nr:MULTISPECIES: polyhydroxyalkanoic acid system family protein [Janthinobacterium]MCA1863199.1 polyhydroxyalkanoic acid system family protein [Janthinobacterium lividum]PHV34498.1 polyhydroxyalkanoic acid system protein [Janthinobacterium sp. BJB312]WFR80811.1 polyhydroxyalkanoic acid system family protein [Janthinobacterium rivuli]